MTKNKNNKNVSQIALAHAVRGKKLKILVKAVELFAEEGYQGVSMERLAAAVPVSKPTIYAHFKDKHFLFSEAVKYKCKSIVTTFYDILNDVETDPQITLAQFALHYSDVVVNENNIKFQAMLVAERQRVPDIARQFYEQGPAHCRTGLGRYLSAIAVKHQLDIFDPFLCADMFLAMIRGVTFIRGTLGLELEQSRRERHKTAQEAVRIFLNGVRQA